MTEGLLTEKILSSTDLSEKLVGQIYPVIQGDPAQQQQQQQQLSDKLVGQIYPVIQGDTTHERVMLDYTQDTQDWESFDSSQGKKS